MIEDILADRNTFQAIFITGRGSLIRRNQVVETGGTTAQGVNADGVGIVLQGPSHRVIDNDIITVTTVGAGIGRAIYFATLSDNGMAVNNRITTSGPVQLTPARRRSSSSQP